MNELALETLCRWESAGGHWLVLSRRPAGLIVSLLRCDGGEEMQRIASVDPAFEAYMAAHCSPEAPGRLVMIETSPTDWPAWECHSEGDELVIVLEGEAEFMQQIDGSELRFAVRAGDTVINPAGVWHTANVTKPLRAIYITPCPGTQHRPR